MRKKDRLKNTLGHNVEIKFQHRVLNAMDVIFRKHSCALDNFEHAELSPFISTRRLCRAEIISYYTDFQ